MQLSACTIALRTRSSEEAFRLLARLGYRNLDVFAYGKQAHFSREMEPVRRRAVLDLAKQLGLQIVAFAGSVGGKFTSDVEDERRQEIQRVQAEIDLGLEAGASIVRISPGSGEDFGKVMDRAVPYIKEVVQYAERKKIGLAMENHSGSITRDPENTAELCRTIGSRNLGVIYEPGNLLGIECDYKKALTTMKDHILHVHLKDGYAHYFGEKGDGFAPQRLFCTLFGEGQLDFQWIMDNLNAIGYNQFVSVEYEGCWHPEYHLPPDEEGLAQLKTFMARWLK